jgi:hypothetical protein
MMRLRGREILQSKHGVNYFGEPNGDQTSGGLNEHQNCLKENLARGWI